MMAISKRHLISVHVPVPGGKSFFSLDFNQEVIFPMNDVLVIYCYVANHYQTQWLTTKK